MTIRVAINGYGRIGRNILRALYEGEYREHVQVVAINDLADIEMSALLTKYDSTHGRFAADVQVDERDLMINGDRIKVVADRDPQNLPWKALDVDVVLECTGHFTSKEKASLHLQSGAKKVLISAPGKQTDATIVYGVNHDSLKAEHTVVSNASCTTNCLAPIAKVLHDAVGIESGLMTTVHAYTNDQVLIDAHHGDPHRARSATQSMIPTKTGAAQAVGLVLPELDGKLDGYAVRVPTINVSLVDLSFVASKPTSADALNTLMQDAAQGAFKNIIAYNAEPLVSIDFNHHPASAIFESSRTKVIGSQVKVAAWYDNEWGFSNRMLDTLMAMMRAT